MKLSARNGLKGNIVEIKEGAVNSIVKVKIGEEIVTSSITIEAVKNLGLESGKDVYVVVKASSVMVAPGKERLALSARNQLAGKVSSVQKGAVNGVVKIALPDGQQVSSVITNASIEELKLEEGVDALAVIKSSEVMIAVD